MDWRGGLAIHRPDRSEIGKVASGAEANGGTIGYAITWNGVIAGERNGRRRFRAASTVKIPLMVELYRQVDAGAVSLDDVRPLLDEDRTPGSGVLQHFRAGVALTLDDLCTLMIAISDNTATNLLLDLVGMERVAATMRSLGMTDSEIGRRMLGRLPTEQEGENWAAPLDYAKALMAIVDGTAASPAGCEQMLTMLERQTATRRVTRYVPVGVRCGSKPGSLLGVTNDVGFVQTADGTLVVSMFCEDLGSEEEAERVIAEIAREAMIATGILGEAQA
jgi:beta-lactamase class A